MIEMFGPAGAAVAEQMMQQHKKTLRDIVKQFRGVRIAVLGDPMLDYYHFGHVTRISPEAPVPVFVEDKIDLRDGGAGNVVENLRGLGCDALPLFPPAPYSMKHRYFVGAQQVGMRIDRDKDHSNHTGMGTGDAHIVAGEVPKAFIISDYGKGWCSQERCAKVISTAQQLGVPVIVDPKGPHWEKYAGADIVCPNHLEMAERRKFDFGRRDPHGDFPYVLQKKGPDGMTLGHMEPGTGVVGLRDFHARARQVFDVTGAGDTVVAVLAAALAVRAEYAIAAELANIAAGIVVGHVGTTPITAHVLLSELYDERR